jgi:PAS domain S-box-containing protein
LAATAGAVFGYWLLQPVLEGRVSFSAIYCAIAITVWFGGWKPALLAAILGYLALDLIFFETAPQAGLSLSSPGGVAALSLYLLCSTLIIGIGSAMRTARRRANAAMLESLQNQRQLQESEERFRRLADAAPVLIWISGTDKLCTWFNKQWLEFVGRPMECELGNGWSQNVHPEDFDRCLQSYTEAFDARRPFSMEYRLRRRDGEYRWVLDNGTPLHASDGEFIGYVGSGVDITDRHRAQEASEAAKLQLQMITDTMAAPVTRCSRDMRYLWVSKSYAGWLDRTPDQIVGRDIFDVVGEDAFRKLLPRFQSVLAGERVQYDKQIYLRDIGPRWIHAIYTPTFDAAGVVDGWVAVVNDITERKELEEAKESERRKDEFVAILAHELRNPLAPIRNAVHILRTQPLPTPDLQWAGEIIDRQIQNMTRLIDDLLDISRITQDALELRKERVDLARVVQSAVETSRPLIDAAGHQLTVSLPPSPVHVDADITRLAQVFANLLNNAAKYCERPGNIALTARCEGDHVVVSVRDDGIGIPKEMLHRIFEMFSQVEGPVERRQGGLGIGLTIAKRLVEMHGGTIDAYSDGPGKGSEFIVRLHAVAPAAPELKPDIDPKTIVPPQKGRILVADDNMDAATGLTRMLDNLRYETRTAHHGLQALEVASEFHPDIALLDIGMPKLSGYEVARRIRKEAWGKDMILIAVTGWGQARDRSRSFEAGFDHHLVKPVDPKFLVQLLASEGGQRRDRPVVT